MNDFTDLDSTMEAGRLLSLSERKLAAALPAALPAPFAWARARDAIRVVTLGDEDSFKFRPTFLIRNQKTQHLVAIEPMTPAGLSRVNLMTLRFISDAYHASGDEFLLIVDGAYDGPAVGALRRDGVRTAWIGEDNKGAAGPAILDFLAARDQL